MIQALGVGSTKDVGQMFVLGITRRELEELATAGRPLFLRFADIKGVVIEDVRALLVVVGSTDKDIADTITGHWRRAGLSVTRPDEPACHYLRNGRTPCMMAGAPDTWPSGHSWVRMPETGQPDDPGLTCEVCRSMRAGGMVT